MSFKCVHLKEKDFLLKPLISTPERNSENTDVS
jgi:hypothetical protein